MTDDEEFIKDAEAYGFEVEKLGEAVYRLRFRGSDDEAGGEVRGAEESSVLHPREGA